MSIRLSAFWLSVRIVAECLNESRKNFEKSSINKKNINLITQLQKCKSSILDERNMRRPIFLPTFLRLLHNIQHFVITTKEFERFFGTISDGQVRMPFLICRQW